MGRNKGTAVERTYVGEMRRRLWARLNSWAGLRPGKGRRGRVGRGQTRRSGAQKDTVVVVASGQEGQGRKESEE